MVSNNIDFLCIGAQKTATSWLRLNLKHNNSIWLPPRKELHYFDRSLKYPSPSFLATNSPLKRLFSLQEHNKLFRKKLKVELFNIVKTKDKNMISWYLSYFFGYYNDDWYKSLFKDADNKIKGEVTPAYSILDIEDIQHIKELFPNLKIILILRDPIQRAWSQIRFNMTRNKFNVDSNFDEIKSYIDSPMQFLRSDYIRMINNWCTVFDDKQIHICFYDDLQKNPTKFLHDIFDFLGADNNKYNNANLNMKINTSIVQTMPNSIEKYLAKKYLSELDKLSKILPNLPDVWIENCQRIIKND